MCYVDHASTNQYAWQLSQAGDLPTAQVDSVRDRLNPVAVYTGVGSSEGVSLVGRHPMGFVNYKLTIAINKYYFAISPELLQAVLIIFFAAKSLWTSRMVDTL